MQLKQAADEKYLFGFPVAAFEIRFSWSPCCSAGASGQSVHSRTAPIYRGSPSIALWFYTVSHNSGSLTEQDYIQNANTADLNPSECKNLREGDLCLTGVWCKMQTVQ